MWEVWDGSQCDCWRLCSGHVVSSMGQRSVLRLRNERSRNGRYHAGSALFRTIAMSHDEVSEKSDNLKYRMNRLQLK